MKTKQVLSLIFATLFVLGWQAQLGGQDIPANYIQNPNMEHDLNPIFWYGSWDYTWGSNGIAQYPDYYLTTDDAHSGNTALKLDPGGWIWVSYPIRGHEEKKFKASFWYKGYFNNYWNFLYRDAGITYEELPWELAEYTGADSCGWGGEGQDALQFWFGGEDGYTEDWTYFEFVWDFPGTLPGWGNTSMWWGEFDPAYVDDLYYGEWYDGEYAGEEPFGFINGDFELQDLNVEWTLNVSIWDIPDPTAYLSYLENHTEAGLQSLGLIDYMSISEEGDTSSFDRNVTYYLPALGAEEENMEISFWYKGNEAIVGLEFYDDYGVTQEEFPLPEGSMLWEDLDNPIFEFDTLETIIDTVDTYVDTFTVAELGEGQVVLEMMIDTMTLMEETVLASQDFDDEENLRLTEDAWVWSGSENWGWDDWDAATKEDEAFSAPQSLWLPGDPNWGGAEGYVSVEDNTSYIWEFMYIGKLQFILNLSGAKYDLLGDPDGIVPEGATADADGITWELDADYWTRFRFEYTQGTWLADSSAESPATVSFNLIGTYDAADLGFVDNVMVATGTLADPVVVDTMYVVEGTTYITEESYVLDTVSTTYNALGAYWTLPAVAEWTEVNLSWTNPADDIGGTLTMFLDNDSGEAPEYITPDKQEFDYDHSDWTFFDDFFYGIAEGTGINRDLVQYDLYTYPNPATDVLYLSLQIPLRRVEVFNAVGQRQIDLNNPDRILDISTLEGGIFFIHATDGNGVVHKAKFIKQ
jgi:hypothetical protein